MSTITEERGHPQPSPESGSRWSLDRIIAARPPITAETLAFAAIFLIAFGLRFWDLGARAMHHDESLHATYS